MSLIVRVYRARVRPGREADYVALLEGQVLPAAHTTDGLAAFHIARRLDGPTTEFLIITVWRDRAAVEAVAGRDWHQPIFFTGEETLIEGFSIEHFEAIGTSASGSG